MRRVHNSAMMKAFLCHLVALLIAVFINPGAASFFGSKSKSENSQVPEP
jgi:hypothetical protein